MSPGGKPCSRKKEKGKRKKEIGFSVRSSCGGDGDLIDDGERARGVGGELEKAE